MYVCMYEKRGFYADGTIHIMCTVRERDRGDQKCSIVIADRVPPKNKHPPILCTYTALWAISRRCPAQIVCSSNPFSSIPWNSTRIITASVPANYVFVRGRTNAPWRRVYTRRCCSAHFKEGAGRSLARDMDTILLLGCSGFDETSPIYLRLRTDIPPAALREPFALTCTWPWVTRIKWSERVCARARMFAFIISCIENFLESSWDSPKMMIFG